ncbi:MAG: glycosyltransferase family 2 protein [Flavobacteriales bacterium]|nr:glycosyltransferase family 2 protein [Flavobacteriales bacterium]
MRVAVVILNWNGKSFLEKFLPSVISNSVGATIYVADNASSDGSLDYLKENYPTVKLIDNGENLGFAGGYNKALEKLEEEFFVLLNSDVDVTPNWLEPIIQLFDSDSNIAACQPKILSYHDKSSFEYAGAAGGFIDKFGYPFCRGRIFDSLEKDSGQYDSIEEIFWATGACLFIRSKVYKELGGLDADFFAHMEEIDLCWRIKRAGYSIKVQPASVVYHVGGGTLSKSNPFKTFLNFRNGLELLAKNLPKNELLPKLFMRMVLDGVAAFKFLISGKGKDFLAVIHAHFGFYRRLRKTLGKRSGNYIPVKGQYRGNIVLDYFLKGRKKFSDLPSDKF